MSVFLGKVYTVIHDHAFCNPCCRILFYITGTLWLFHYVCMDVRICSTSFIYMVHECVRTPFHSIQVEGEHYTLQNIKLKYSLFIIVVKQSPRIHAKYVSPYITPYVRMSYILYTVIIYCGSSFIYTTRLLYAERCTRGNTCIILTTVVVKYYT